MLGISVRNQFEGTVTSVHEGRVNAIVTLDCNGNEIVADITMGSVKKLDLAEGREAFALVKASNVMVASAGLLLSARNQLRGIVTSIDEGAVNGIVHLNCGGLEVSADITMASIARLGLKEGLPAVAVIKANDVMVGVKA